MPPKTLLHPLPHAPAPAPTTFNYPHHYTPHPLAIAAAEDLQHHLRTQTDWHHDFGLDHANQPGACGKMFGVLVVDNPAGGYAYLAAYSGKLADSNHLPGFVPPVFDILTDGGFYRSGEQTLRKMHAELERLENAPALTQAYDHLTQTEATATAELEQRKATRRAAKQDRNARRAAATHLPPDKYADLGKRLAKESVTQHFIVKDQTRLWNERIATAQAAVDELQTRIDALKQARADYSHQLQRQIFEHYRFLDANGERRDLLDIFKNTVLLTPPAGAGECAAPKLLQYAYQNDLTPLTMAEFWWGQPPASDIRKHGRYYPACRGKCQPILAHMLRGLDVDPNPLIQNPALGKDLPTVYEDDDLIIVNKPEGFLSVPGRLITDSVQTRLENKYPAAKNHLIVHRLDMSTSGLLLCAKNKETHRLLQQQFFKRSVRKRYVALLDGQVEAQEGHIDLPLRGNLQDRPRQLVDQKDGKPARTRWQLAPQAKREPLPSGSQITIRITNQ